MIDIFQFLLPKTIARIKSSLNGEIKIIEQFGKKELQVGGLQQSGSLVEKIWDKGIKTIKSYLSAQGGKLQVANILILGFGAGSAVKVINSYFPKAKITGVEIDPQIIRIAKKYFDLSKQKNLTIKTADAFKFIKKEKEKHDLILIDLYLGYEIPKKSESKEFIKDLKKILKKGGVVIFNRLRGKDREKELINFQKTLNKEFKTIKTVNPLINRLFICF